MENEIKITLKDQEINSFHTREAANLLLNNIKSNASFCNQYNIVLDFHSIDFMTRSFADQLVFQSKLLEDSMHYKFYFENLNTNLKELINSINHSQECNKRSSKHIPVKKFDTKKDLMEYLVSI